MLSECQLDKFFQDLTPEKREKLKRKLNIKLAHMKYIGRLDEVFNIKFVLERL